MPLQKISACAKNRNGIDWEMKRATYQARYTAGPPPKLYSSIWHDVPAALLDYSWNGRIDPHSEVRCVWCDEGVVIRFSSEEHPINVQYFHHNDPVNRDSCVEVFLNPNESEDNRYLNFELNAAGVLHLQFGDERCRKDIDDVEFQIFHIETHVSDLGWEARLVVPFSFLRLYYTDLKDEWRANFYKCGDRTENPHYLCWAEIPTERPSFHQSKYFGRIRFEK